MQLSQKAETFSVFFFFFFVILKCIFKFEHFQKKYDPHRRCIFELTDSEKCG